MRRKVIQVGVVIGSVLGVVLVTAGPAAAHGGPGANAPAATNYRTRIRSVSPRVEGVELRVIEAGSRLELSNSTGRDVIVVGYQGEPFLRVGPDGVFENTRSPTTYQSASRKGGAKIPGDADPEAEPEWREVTGATTARWHDHRAHWMGGDPPRVVQDEPDREHVVIPEWTVPVLDDGKRIEFSGDLVWVPGPSTLRWWGLALLLALAGAAAVLTKRWREGLVAVTVALVGLSVVDVVGTWTASSEGTVAKVAALGTPVIVWMILAAGAAIAGRLPKEGLGLGAGGAGGIAVIFGVASYQYLTRSQLPTGIEPWAARLSVAGCLGLGVGVAVAGGVRVWRDTRLAPARAARVGTARSG